MTEPYYADDLVTLHLGDCLEVLAGLADDSVDSVVTDPPYGLEFMGREWDAPWRSGINADAGFSAPGLTDGGERLPRPTFTGSTNPVCRNCGGKQRGRRDGTAIWKTCVCEAPKFPNVRATEMRAFQDWCETWAVECLRVLKPGGHLLAFGGTRTWHRLTCAIEDAGFEIRDTVADLTGIDGPGLLWVHGQGFPKSLNVSKAIDKRRTDEIEHVCDFLGAAIEASGMTRKTIGDHMGVDPRGVDLWAPRPNDKSAQARAHIPTREQWARLRELLDFGDEMDAEVRRLNDRKGTPGEAWDQREVVGTAYRVRRESTVQFAGLSDGDYDVTAAATEDAARWEGWGTALKPAWEPIVVGRKPIAGTVALNVVKHGTGALNIGRCIVRHADDADLAASRAKNPGRADTATSGVYGGGRPQQSVNDAGRWPPNVALGEKSAAETDRQSGSNASRIFPVFRYEAKAPASERPRLADGTAHNTVKPLDLMRWLVRLVTPPGGTVADFFAGSGTTGEACVIEGFRCILAEKDPAHAELIKARLSKPIQPDLFGGAA